MHGPGRSTCARSWRIAGPPTDERRQADLAHHIEVKLNLERVSRALEAR